MNSVEVAERIKKIGIVAMIRGGFTIKEMIDIGDALLAAPVLTIEITLNTPGALDGIRELRARFGDNMIVGAQAPSARSNRWTRQSTQVRNLLWHPT